MRVQSVLALLAASVAYAAPIADADYAPQPYEKPTPKPYEAPKPYGYEPKPETFNPLTVLSDAAIAVIKFKLALLKEGAKIILSPFEAAYAAAHDLQPEYPTAGKTYARDADKYEPKPENPLEVISDAALAILKFKLYLISTGAKIILSPFEQVCTSSDELEIFPLSNSRNPSRLLILCNQAYNDKYHPAPSSYKPKTYTRDADKYEPKPYGSKGGDLGDELSEAAIQLLKWKLALLKAGVEIILTPAEILYKATHDVEPAAYPKEKSYYA
jgi:hypothetical protein